MQACKHRPMLLHLFGAEYFRPQWRRIVVQCRPRPAPAHDEIAHRVADAATDRFQMGVPGYLRRASRTRARVRATTPTVVGYSMRSNAARRRPRLRRER